MKILPQFIRRFFTNESGAVLPILGLTLTLLVGATGVAIDMERTQHVQNKLSNSVDAAGLAAGSTISTLNLQAEVEKYLKANFQDFLNSKITSITTSTSDDKSTIFISATAQVPTTLLKVLLIDHTSVKADAEIIRSNKGLELAMVLDNTGSMSGSKLSDLKSAAKDLVNILYGNKTTIPDLFIGLVPFSQAVNIGKSRTSWVNEGSQLWGPVEWEGCVEARYLNNEDVTDTPPNLKPFEKYYWQCDPSYNGWYGSNSNRTNCYLNYYTRLRNDIGLYRGPNKYCAQPVTALTSSKSTIINAVDEMDAAGNTHVNLGAVWGWRMLSPRWKTFWGGEMNSKNLPLNYNTKDMNKAAIIMTDGDNTMSTGVYTAYGDLEQGLLGSTRSSNAEVALDNKLIQVCNAMKTNNIQVYTISFGTISTSSQNMMRNCASQPDYYFNSPNSSDLQRAFRMIGDSLASLRISK